VQITGGVEHIHSRGKVAVFVEQFPCYLKQSLDGLHNVVIKHKVWKDKMRHKTIPTFINHYFHDQSTQVIDDQRDLPVVCHVDAEPHGQGDAGEAHEKNAYPGKDFVGTMYLLLYNNQPTQEMSR